MVKQFYYDKKNLHDASLQILYKEPTRQLNNVKYSGIKQVQKTYFKV